MTTFEALFLEFDLAIAGSSFRGSRRPQPTLLVLLLALTIAVFAATAARADSVVQNCNDDTQLSSALNGGGTVTFDCNDNGSPATIALSSTKTISGDVRLDGGGRITLSGQGAMGLFYVNPGASLDLMNIVLEQGLVGGDGGAVYNAGFLALDSATIRDSKALGNGGAIATIGPVDITRSNLFDNTATNGGAVFASSSGARVSIGSSLLDGNKAVSSQPPQRTRRRDHGHRRRERARRQLRPLLE